MLFLAIISLAVAAAMSGVAWRLAREEERRSDARVELLANGLGTAPGPHRHPAVHLSAVAMAVVAVVCLGLVASAIAGRSPAPSATAQAAPAAPPALPLELVALSHTREAGQLMVRGIVRNPVKSAVIGDLIAVVFAYNDRGEFIASGRAPVEPTRVSPGTESTFAVSIAPAADAVRYRVSFRNADRILAHVDRRASPNQSSTTP